MTLSYSYSVYFALKNVLLELLCLSPLNRCITQAFVMSPLNSLMKLNHDNYTIMHHMIQFVFILSFGSLSHFPWWVNGQLDIAIVISCNSARVFPWHASEIIEYIIIYISCRYFQDKVLSFPVLTTIRCIRVIFLTSLGTHDLFGI